MSETPGHPPVVEGHHVDAQLLGSPRHAVPLRWAHPPLDISPLLRRSLRLNGLAITTHWPAPSSPLVEIVVGIERRQLSWQRGRRLH